MHAIAPPHRGALTSSVTSSRFRNMKSFEHYLQLSTAGCKQGQPSSAAHQSKPTKRKKHKYAKQKNFDSVSELK